MCNLLDVSVKKISNIRQADQVKTADKLQYISVTNSKLKLRVMRNGTKDWVLRAHKMQGGKRCPKTIVIARFDKGQILDDIRMQAAEQLVSFNSTKSDPENTADLVNFSFNAIWEEYCTDASFRGNTPNTQKQKRYSFGRYSEFFSKRKKCKVTQITKQDVRAFQASRQHVRVASNRDLSHMSHFFQFALGEGYIPHNPVTGIKKEWEAPGSDGIKLEQLNDFFIFLKNHPKDFDHETRTYRTNPDGSDYLDPHRLTEANFAKFIILSGARVTEAQNLRYQRITDLNYITHEFCPLEKRSKYFMTLNKHKTIKTVGPRKVALLDHVAECLTVKPPFTYRKFKKQSSYVFPAKRGNGPISRKSIDRFTRLINSQFRDIDTGATVTMRSLRHTFSRLALEHGLTHDELATLLGHTSTEMVRRYYAAPDTAQISRSIIKFQTNLTEETQNT